jgi:hypothetical protein
MTMKKERQRVLGLSFWIQQEGSEGLNLTAPVPSGSLNEPMVGTQEQMGMKPESARLTVHLRQCRHRPGQSHPVLHLRFAQFLPSVQQWILGIQETMRICSWPI